MTSCKTARTSCISTTPDVEAVCCAAGQMLAAQELWRVCCRGLATAGILGHNHLICLLLCRALKRMRIRTISGTDPFWCTVAASVRMLMTTDPSYYMCVFKASCCGRYMHNKALQTKAAAVRLSRLLCLQTCFPA